MALLEANRNRGVDAGVSQWVFDGAIGRISARDSYGNLVMALAAGPLFGTRLAAAFNSPWTLALRAESDLRSTGLHGFPRPHQ